MRPIALALLALLALSGCRYPRTQLVVRVSSEIEYGAGARVETLRVTVRAEGPAGPERLSRTFALAATAPGAGRFALPLSFGVTPRDNVADRVVWIEVLGCGADGCAQGAPFVTQRVITGFVAGQTREVRVVLPAGCDAVQCPSPDETCDARDHFCGPARVDAAALPAVDHDAETTASPPGVNALGAGGGLSCAVLGDGTTRCAGGLDSVVADLAFPSRTAGLRSAFEPVAGLADTARVAVGEGHACALDRGGSVRCFGGNAHGQLGDGTREPRSGVTPVSDLSDVVEVAAGREHTCARTRSGEVRCWGAVVDPDRPSRDVDRLTPAPSPLVGDVVELAAGGAFDCARLRDHTLRCFGRNESGQLGAPDTRSHLDPVTVQGVTDAIGLAAGARHACARVRDRARVVCWGDNAFGQRGTGDTTRAPSPTYVEALLNTVQLTAGASHTCARLGDGTAWCWGRNDRGQLGDGTTQDRARPVRVGTLTDVAEIRAGLEHTCARLRSGEARCFGGDTAGQLGSGRTTARGEPVGSTVPDASALSGGGASTCALTGSGTACWGLVRAAGRRDAQSVTADGPRVATGAATSVAGVPARIRQVALGWQHGCALLADGAVECWGGNEYGQLGDGTRDSRPSPVRVRGVRDAVHLAAGTNATCAVLRSGAVVCWGRNTDGALGFATTQRCGAEPCALEPGEVRGLRDATRVSVGFAHACATDRAGALRCWGRNDTGQCGGSDLTPRSAPTLVPGSPTGVTDVAVGDAHTCFIDASQSVFCLGAANNGQVVNHALLSFCGTTLCATLPIAVSPAMLLRAVALSAGNFYTCAISAERTVHCWGGNSAGQSGSPRGAPCPAGTCTPGIVRVPGVSDALQIVTGLNHACARVEGAEGLPNEVYCWGDGLYGQVGIPGELRSMPRVAVALRGATEIAAGRVSTCARLADGRLRCVGDNAFGQVGDGVIGNPRVPTRVAGIDDAIAATVGSAHACVLRRDRTVWCFGANLVGQLGDGTQITRATAAPVSGLAGVTAVASAYDFVCALREDRSVWCWGQGDAYQLGNDVPAHSRVPVRVSLLDDVVQLEAGGHHACVLREGGSVWCWGPNMGGEGGGTVSTLRVPTRVPGLGRPAVQLALSAFTSCARLDDGSVWCWGAGYAGQRGDGTRVPIRPIPARVAGLGAAVDLRGNGEQFCARTADRALHCWGSNNEGELGDGTREPALVPIRVPLGEIDRVTHATSGAGCGIRPDGTVDCWGTNFSFELGNGTTESSATPGPVAGLRDVVDLAAGRAQFCAVDRAGGAYCWGENPLGQLGNGTTSSRREPVLVRGLGQVAGVTAGFGFGCAWVDDGGARCFGANALGQLGDGLFADSDTGVVPMGLAGVVAIDAGIDHACARIDDGTVRCWGRADRGQLGGSTSSLARPFAVAVPTLSGVDLVAAGGAHTCVVQRGEVACFGANDRGQLGRETRADCPVYNLAQQPTGARVPCDPSPLRVPGLSGVTALALGGAHSCALRADGSVACWGDGSHGQLGDGARASSVAPVAVRGLAGVVELRAGRRVRCTLQGTLAPQCAPSGEDHVCARTASGEVYCWGANDRGQLGDGTREDRDAPVLVRGVQGATGLAVGGAHACARVASGVVCWGDDSEGQLGEGARVYAATPLAPEGLN